MLNWLKSKLFSKRYRDSIPFRELKTLQFNGQPEVESTFELLKDLDHSTSDSKVDEIVAGINNIRYASNTNGVFHFFFPLVIHVLYFKPEQEDALLFHLIGPNFANGEQAVDGMIDIIRSAMEYRLIESPLSLSKEGIIWVTDELPKMRSQIEREIRKCQAQL